MARSFSNVKVVSALLVDGFSNPLITRRGYAATAQSATIRGKASMSNQMASSMEDKAGKASSSEKVSWVPDPKTGYYKPENINEIIDAADLRATLLNKKFNH